MLARYIEEMPSDMKGLKTKTPATDQFDAFPDRLAGDLCWTSEDFNERKDKYIIDLSEEHIRAINRAIAFFKGTYSKSYNWSKAYLSIFKALGMELPYICPETFPLPQDLSDLLRQISNQLHDGIGFAVLRGLNPKFYDDEENVIAYCGLVSYVGAERITNAFGMSMSKLH